MNFPRKYAKFVEKYSNQFGVDKNLVYAVIRCESSFNQKAISEKGAVGLMQLMPNTARWCAQSLSIDYLEDKLYDIEYNIMLGTYYLSYLFCKFNSIDYVVMAYNAGEGNVKKWLNENSVPFKETQLYLSRVKFSYKAYLLMGLF